MSQERQEQLGRLPVEAEELEAARWRATVTSKRFGDASPAPRVGRYEIRGRLGVVEPPRRAFASRDELERATPAERETIEVSLRRAIADDAS